MTYILFLLDSMWQKYWTHIIFLLDNMRQKYWTQRKYLGDKSWRKSESECVFAYQIKAFGLYSVVSEKTWENCMIRFVFQEN